MTKYPTSEVMKAIMERCPGALVVVLNFDEEANTVDVAMSVTPRTAAAAMRHIGDGMCRALEIPDDTGPN